MPGNGDAKASLPCWRLCLEFVRTRSSGWKPTIWPSLVGSGDGGAQALFPFWRRCYWRTLFLVHVLSWYVGADIVVAAFRRSLQVFSFFRLGIALVLNDFVVCRRGPLCVLVSGVCSLCLYPLDASLWVNRMPFIEKNKIMLNFIKMIQAILTNLCSSAHVTMCVGYTKHISCSVASWI